ncbi:MAG: hypothetical protein LBN11_06285, partial [Tannerella sp.]|nr:hypothetical protein [Tannerella sp.]
GNYILSFTTGRTFAITAAPQTTPQFADHTTTYRTFGASPFYLPAVAGGESTGALSYRSSDPYVATVDANGRVTLQGPGTAVIYVKRLGDANYTDSGEDSITLNVAPESTPVIYRPVTLPVLSGGPTIPSAGTYHIPSGGDFEFRIFPDGTRAGIPSITTNRSNDKQGGVKVTPNDNGSYTVRITNIREPITISLNFATSNEEITKMKVWSYNSRLHLTSPTAGTAYVYNITGVLVKIIPYTAGETLTEPMEKGIYIVKTEKETFKIRN